MKCQDHERAYFDSADWALGKVLILFCTPFGKHKSRNDRIPLRAVNIRQWFIATARCREAQRTTGGPPAKATGNYKSAI